MTSSVSAEHGAFVVCGLGATTPLGRTAWSSGAAVRAGISGFTQHPFMVDADGEPMHVAACAWLPPDASVVARMSDCLVGAIRGALRDSSANGGPQPAWKIALFVGFPAERPGVPADIGERLRDALEDDFPQAFIRTSFARGGHAAGFALLRQAQKLLAAGSADACLIAATDSYLEPDTLEWLEMTEQLHGAAPRNNAWGFIPGEGAGAVLVATREAARRHGMTPLAEVVATALAREDKLIRTSEVCVGRGLTNAFQTALADLPAGARITDVVCDMNGDPYRADEFAFAVLRTRERFLTPSEFVAPADCWGDVGAASAPLLLVLTVIALYKAYSNGAAALVWCSSDTGERGAALIARVSSR
jgi:3-oxoacyl-[acyl-carrier-protein] synthase-1